MDKLYEQLALLKSVSQMKDNEKKIMNIVRDIIFEDSEKSVDLRYFFAASIAFIVLILLASKVIRALNNEKSKDSAV